MREQFIKQFFGDEENERSDSDELEFKTMQKYAQEILY